MATKKEILAQMQGVCSDVNSYLDVVSLEQFNATICCLKDQIAKILTTNPNSPRLFNSSGSEVGISQGGDYTYTIPANTLKNNGDCIVVQYTVKADQKNSSTYYGLSFNIGVYEYAGTPPIDTAEDSFVVITASFILIDGNIACSYSAQFSSNYGNQSNAMQELLPIDHTQDFKLTIMETENENCTVTLKSYAFTYYPYLPL